MTSAINIFLIITIIENGILFPFKLNTPNNVTVSAIKESREITYDKTVKGYSSTDNLFGD